jgi:hypothetical protein
MPVLLLVGPFVALIGIGAIYFVLRRKSVDKRSMYSARRSQIEHKVRAARQRTLVQHGHSEAPAQAPAGAQQTSVYAPPAAPGATYEPSAYEPPPAAPPPAVKGMQEAPAPSPWDVGPTAPAPSQFAVPEPAQVPEPTFEPAPTEAAWTPTSAPAEPAMPVEPVRPASPAAAPAAWSVVSEAKESASVAADQPKKKGKKGEPTGAWQLASGEAPGDESDEAVRPPGQTVAIAQYAVLVVGLVAVLIGVLIMVASVPIK